MGTVSGKLKECLMHGKEIFAHFFGFWSQGLTAHSPHLWTAVSIEVQHTYSHTYVYKTSLGMCGTCAYCCVCVNVAAHTGRS